MEIAGAKQILCGIVLNPFRFADHLIQLLPSSFANHFVALERREQIDTPVDVFDVARQLRRNRPRGSMGLSGGRLQRRDSDEFRGGDFPLPGFVIDQAPLRIGETDDVVLS